MKRTRTKILALILSLIMLFGLVTPLAAATEGEDPIAEPPAEEPAAAEQSASIEPASAELFQVVYPYPFQDPSLTPLQPSLDPQVSL